MRDADRRRLLVLAEARASALCATTVVQRLVASLDALKLEPATRVAKDLVDRLMEIREHLTQQIGEVSS